MLTFTFRNTHFIKVVRKIHKLKILQAKAELKKIG
jgi:hypothetical protein